MPKKAMKTGTRTTTISARRRGTRAASNRTTHKSATTTVPKNIAVYGVYRDNGQLKRGVQRLRSAGFRHLNVSPLLLEQATGKARNPVIVAEEPTVEMVRIAARIAGCLAGIALAPLAPLAAWIPVVEEREPVNENNGALLKVQCEGLDRLQSATEILEATGSRDVATSVESISGASVSDRLNTIARGQDLQTREYRDSEGKLHHHTHSFIERHDSEMTAV